MTNKKIKRMLDACYQAKRIRGATGGGTPETGGSTGGISPAFGTEPGICGSADGFGRRTGSPQNVQNFASSRILFPHFVQNMV